MISNRIDPILFEFASIQRVIASERKIFARSNSLPSFIRLIRWSNVFDSKGIRKETYRIFLALTCNETICSSCYRKRILTAQFGTNFKSTRIYMFEEQKPSKLCV